MITWSLYDQARLKCIFAWPRAQKGCFGHPGVTGPTDLCSTERPSSWDMAELGIPVTVWARSSKTTFKSPLRRNALYAAYSYEFVWRLFGYGLVLHAWYPIPFIAHSNTRNERPFKMMFLSLTSKSKGYTQINVVRRAIWLCPFVEPRWSFAQLHRGYNIHRWYSSQILELTGKCIQYTINVGEKTIIRLFNILKY